MLSIIVNNIVIIKKKNYNEFFCILLFYYFFTSSIVFIFMYFFIFVSFLCLKNVRKMLTFVLFWSDMQLHNVVLPSNRVSNFLKTLSQKLQDTRKEKVTKKHIWDLQRLRGSHEFCTGDQTDPNPSPSQNRVNSVFIGRVTTNKPLLRQVNRKGEH